MKKINIGVSDFALPAPRRGSIDIYSGFGPGAKIGLELHQKIQAEHQKTHPNYQAEVLSSKTFSADNFEFEISGRMDGVFAATDENPTTKIEEIKSAFNIYELSRKLRASENQHPYLLQLLTYGYFEWATSGKLPLLNMLLVSSRKSETISMNIKLDVHEYEKWVALRLAELVQEARRAEKRVLRRQKTAKNLAFPYAKARPSQIELIETVNRGMSENKRMLIQAPTGLGKTIGVLYPTLREAMERGQRVIYATPKNSQHAVAEDAIDRLQESGANIKSMTFTAKSKMCFKNEPICNPDFCEFAKDHYTKVAENKIIEHLAKKRSLTAKNVKKIAREFEVCPFELQIDAAAEADAIICDYNYVFAPHSVFSRFSGIHIDQQGQPNLIIDEAHNLPSRAMDYYSPSLSTHTLEQMCEDLQLLPQKFRTGAAELLNECIRVIKNCEPEDCKKPVKITPPVTSFLEHDAQLKAFLSLYLQSDVDIQPRDVVMRLSFYWSAFAEALEFVLAGRHEFFTTYSPHPPAISITCCDASEMLKHSYDNYDQIVGFSATLKPFEFYSKLTGLESEKLKTAEFSSPFPKSNRKLLIIPQISSKYSQREKNYSKIAETIQKIISLKAGNYVAFFSSFDFMKRVLELFKAPPDFEILRQERAMRTDAISEILLKLGEKNCAHILFAVQGGVFSEGVDYAGDMLIGAFVVGPPLPNFDTEREHMREYYENKYAAGFDYAYAYPAMAKAVQAAGRVIRSDIDRGLIILMDDRFIQHNFAKSMPQDWYEASPKELVSERILHDVREFWLGAQTAQPS